MTLLNKLDLNGIKIYERKTTFDKLMNYTWDADVAIEVISNDAYRLRILKERNVGIKTILDIGGNIGAFTLFAKHLWPEAKVITAEPFHDNMELLKKNCEGLNDITFVEKAIVGAKSKSQKMKFLPPSFEREYANKNAGDGHLSEDGTIEVDVCGLLDIFPNDGVDLLKLDCEGAELQILSEAKELGLFEKIRIIRGETHTLEDAEKVKALLSDDYWYISTIRGVLGAFSADTKRVMA